MLVSVKYLLPDFFQITCLILPTCPFSSITLIPCGWTGDVVSTSFTFPPVSLPVRLCSASSTITEIPGLISALRVPSIVN